MPAAERILHYRDTYSALLVQGQEANPREPPNGKRGATKQSKALNLIDRLVLYADDVWRFMTDAGVPFTNNIAEQAVPMPKVKQKVSEGSSLNQRAGCVLHYPNLLGNLAQAGREPAGCAGADVQRPTPAASAGLRLGVLSSYYKKSLLSVLNQ